MLHTKSFPKGGGGGLAGVSGFCSGVSRLKDEGMAGRQPPVVPQVSTLRDTFALKPVHCSNLDGPGGGGGLASAFKPRLRECRARSAKFWMSPSTKGSIKQRVVQNAFGRVHKSLHTTCLKITHTVLIMATGRSRGHTKDWIVPLENGPSPSQPQQCARSAHAVQELPLRLLQGAQARQGAWGAVVGTEVLKPV